jgi:hypothetical protein
MTMMEGGSATRRRAAAAVLVALSVLAASCAAAATSTRRTTTTMPLTTRDAVQGAPAPGLPTSLLAVSCGTATHCWAVGQGPVTADPSTSQAATVLATIDAGAVWTVQPTTLPGDSTLNGVSCVGQSCMAVGETAYPVLAGAALVTEDGGGHWLPVAPPVGAVDLLGVSCTAADVCTALATDGSAAWSAATDNGGQVWTRGGDLPEGFGGERAISCLPSGSCAVAGYVSTQPGKGAGAVAVSTDDGMAWTLATVPSGTGLLHAVDCTADGDCLAVGTQSTVTSDVAPGSGAVLASTDGGSTFESVTAPTTLNDGLGVACGTDQACAAVGTQWSHALPPVPLAGVVTTPDLGESYAAPDVHYVPSTLDAVACPATCVAVGGDTVARFPLPGAIPGLSGIIGTGTATHRGTGATTGTAGDHTPPGTE